MKKTAILLLIISAIVASACAGCAGGGEDAARVVIITTVYAPYDFAREITKGVEGISIKMLVTPGEETHTFEPTPRDIIALERCDLFIYSGGENDEWVGNIMDSLSNKNMQQVVMTDCVQLLQEEHIEGMEEESHDDEYDEHVWTSIRNSQIIVSAIAAKLALLDADNADTYLANSDKYNASLIDLDGRIGDMVASAARKTIIMADRFPIRYFAQDYGLGYYAAFSGCSHETEPSAKTTAFLLDKVKELGVPIVFILELSNGKIAQTITEGTDAKTAIFYTCHNVSAADFDRGLGYYDMMQANYLTLMEALN